MKKIRVFKTKFGLTLPGWAVLLTHLTEEDIMSG